MFARWDYARTAFDPRCFFFLHVCVPLTRGVCLRNELGLVVMLIACRRSDEPDTAVVARKRVSYEASMRASCGLYFMRDPTRVKSPTLSRRLQYVFFKPKKTEQMHRTHNFEDIIPRPKRRRKTHRFLTRAQILSGEQDR